MNVFIEKEFIENFEIMYSDNAHLFEWKLLYVLFTEYTNINLFINSTDEDFEKVINNSEILRKLSDINPNIKLYSDLKKEIQNSNSVQTLVFTEKEKDWLNKFDNQAILHFTYGDFAYKLNSFINKYQVEIDLSDKEIKFNWSVFNFLSEKSNFIFITDPYILKDNSGQKIKDNLIPLLNNNLNKTKHYKIFIISELSDINVKDKLRKLYSGLANPNVKIYLINRFKGIDKGAFHDRLLYSNYSITTSGIGFNINSNKNYNSEVSTKTIFYKKTYKKYINHFKLIGEYIEKLEKYSDYNNSFKTNEDNLYQKYRSLNII